MIKMPANAKYTAALLKCEDRAIPDVFPTGLLTDLLRRKKALF